MICRVALFQYKEGSKHIAEACADQLTQLFSELNGFKGITFIGHYDKDIYGSATLWETPVDAEQAAEPIRAKLLELAGDHIVEVLFHNQYDVYEPKA